MKLTIKNMVCRHCVATVRRVLSDELHLPVQNVELGSAELADTLTDAQLAEVATALGREGFELIQSREAAMVDDVKRLLIEATRREWAERINISDELSQRFNISYASLSRMFSEIEGRSIENYYIGLKVERVKELIRYRQLSLSEIADCLGYSSVAHLSRQFKQVTGLTPTQFREMGQRKPLSEV